MFRVATISGRNIFGLGLRIERMFPSVWGMDGDSVTSSHQSVPVDPVVVADPGVLLQAAVDALALLDVSALSTSELADVCVGVQRQVHRLSGVSAQLLDRWHSSGVWGFDGSRSSASRLARETRSSLRSCRVDLRRARVSAGLPVVTQAVVDGELSVDHLDLFGVFATPERSEAMGRDESFLVDQCRRLNFAKANKVLAYWAQAVDATDESSSADCDGSVEDSSTVYLSETFQGTWVMDATLTAVTGSIIANELLRLEKLIAESDAQSGWSRTPAQRRAAALLEMATRSAAMPPESKKPRPLLTVLVGEQSLSHICELANGTVLSPTDLLPMLSTTDLETVLFDGPHTVISVSRARRFTGAVRKAIEVRDRHCTHPSDCDVPADRCDVDHIIPFSEHGPTSQFNGRLQCATHNRNASRHAHSTSEPISPPRPITELDHIRCRLRYNYRNNHPDPDPDP